eukprot:2184106-Rhodomonas_salina.2
MGGRKGFYVRPSKAVELGGGFFVPGLEGPKLRSASLFAGRTCICGNNADTHGGRRSVAIGVLALVLLGLNRVLLAGEFRSPSVRAVCRVRLLLTYRGLVPPGYQPLPSQLYSESITFTTTLFLLGQALFETFSVGTEESASAQSSSSSNRGRPDQFVFSPSLSPSQRKKMEWLVGSVQQVTSAGTTVFVLGKDGSLVSPQPDMDTLSMVESFDPGTPPLSGAPNCATHGTNFACGATRMCSQEP